ncbi:MAG TPA: ABC transporter permease [Candidatus Acidoferrales bacterium]
MPSAPFSLKLYRFLLKFYPAGFQNDYAGPMEREFRDELADSSGGFALAKLWVRLLTDLAVSIPLQFSRELFQDARYTLRLWANRPGQTGFAILALAIGIGANTGVFSVVNALLLRSLPFHDPSRLVSLGTFFPPHSSAKEFHEWRQQQRSYLADAALIEQFDVNLGAAQNSVRAHLSYTSWNFFAVLGVQPVLGRWFRDGEDTPGENAVAVISYGLWQKLFAGDQRALGSTIRVKGTPLTVVGVAPAGFNYPNNSDVWYAANFSPGNNGWQTIARLEPRITWPQARAAFALESDRLWPQRAELGNSEHYPRMTSLQDELAGPVKNASMILLAGVVLILLIACSNVANLLLARSADRATELSIRSALGASRARIAQQLLTECLMLSFVASIAGLLVAWWTTSLATKVQPAPLFTQSYSILDARVLGFAVAAAIASSVFFGALPSLYAGRIHAHGARAASSSRGARLIRETLIAAQVMLTIILLTASVSVGRAFVSLMKSDRGFAAKGLVTVSVSLDGTTRAVAGHQLPYFEEVLDRIRRLPGVRSASETEFLPLDATGFVGGPFGFDGRPAKLNSTMIPVLSDYFKTMGGRILYGREFTDAEVRSDAQDVVVNEQFAKEFGSAVGVLEHEVTIGESTPRKIIGVVTGMDYMTDTMDTGHSNQIFIPAHSPGGFVSTFVARVDGRAEDSLPAIRDTIRSVDTQVPVFGVKTMEERMADAVARPKFYRTAILFFAGFALFLAVIGIYAVVSYAVAVRTHEMGVRLALGATPAGLRGNMLWQGLLTVVAGATFGISGAMLTGRFLENLVQGAKSVDLATLILSFFLIALVASGSIWAGTRRIARLDILDILRIE